MKVVVTYQQGFILRNSKNPNNSIVKELGINKSTIESKINLLLTFFYFFFVENVRVLAFSIYMLLK